MRPTPNANIAERDPGFTWPFRDAPVETDHDPGVLCRVATTTNPGYGSCLRKQEIAGSFAMSDRGGRRVVGELEAAA